MEGGREERRKREKRENKRTGENPASTCTPCIYNLILCHALRPNTGTLDTQTQAQTEHAHTQTMYTVQSMHARTHTVYKYSKTIVYFMSWSAVAKLRTTKLHVLCTLKHACTLHKHCAIASHKKCGEVFCTFVKHFVSSL